MMKKLVLLTILAAMFAVTASTASAATCSVSAAAPEINSLDIANYAASTGTEKWWAEDKTAGDPKGQTFTTGDMQAVLNSITFEIGDGNSAEPAKTYVIRLSTIDKVNPADSSTWVLQPFYSEQATQDAQWIGSSEAVSQGVDPAPFMTWTFDSPVLLEADTEYAIDIGLTESELGWESGIPYIKNSGNEYSGGTRYTPDRIGIGVGGTSMKSVSGDRIFHLDIDAPLNPSPSHGSSVPAGEVELRWTNIDPNDGFPVYADVWFGTDPSSDFTKVVDLVQDANTVTVNAPGADTYYWKVDLYFGGDTSTPAFSASYEFIVFDSDADGLPDEFELAYTDPQSATSMNPDDDLETDGLTNLEEYQLGTNPVVFDTDGDTLGDGDEIAGTAGDRPATDPLLADTDGDGLDDGAESNTGIYINADDTGTNPANPDTDADGLVDGIETNTGTFVDETDTGTSPLAADTDADGAGDWYEIVASFTNPTNAADLPNVPYPLPDPDPCDIPPGFTTKPVKVYIMSGQSNMVGAGKRSGTGDDTLETMTVRQNKFPNLIDESNAWTTRQDVQYRGVISDITNAKLSPGNLGGTFGPELGFGYIMGWYHDEPVLLLKSCTGNRGLGWDILPPGSPSYQYDGYQFAGYGESPENWLIGTTPEPINWYAGKEFDRFFMDESEWAHPDDPATNVVDVLDNFATQYPEYASQGFKIAGFVWWQGDRDRYKKGHAAKYEENLVNLIKSLRNYYTNRYPGQVVPNAPFVLATLGQTVLGDSSNPAEEAILNAQLAVDGEAGNYPEFAGNVKTVYSHPLSKGGASNGHYNGHAETYMLVGDALGRAMIELDAAFPVDAGDNMVTWSGEPVEMNPVVDLDPNVTNETYTWTAVTTVEGTVVDISDASAEAPTVTITKPAGEMAVVTLTLTVDDGENAPVRNSVSIEVYDDACKAGLGIGLDEDHPTDIVGDDCVTDLEDLAAIAARWLDNKALSTPMHKPAE